MMRLFDRVAEHGPKVLRDRIRKGGAECPQAVLVIDEIAKHFYYHKGGNFFWTPKHYPYVTPPWGRSFVEWDSVAYQDVREGAFVTHIKDKDEVQAMRAGFGGKCANHDGTAVSLEFISFNKGQFFSDGTSAQWLINSDGGIESMRLDYDRERYTNPDQVAYMMKCMSTIVALGFSFANVNNVKLDDSTKEFAPPPRLQRRLRIPETKSYTLNINGHSTLRSSQTECSETGIMPFHLCRGHFATYTEEKPLFGKYVGRFWISAHTRGNKKNGVIEKDYKITSGALQPA